MRVLHVRMTSAGPDVLVYMRNMLSARSALVSLSSVAVIAVLTVQAAPGSARAATPAPSPSCAVAPDGFTFAASTSRVESGQSVTLTITYRQCSGPEHHFTVSSRPLGQPSPISTVAHVTTTAGDTTSASLTVTPDHSTTYLASEDGQTYTQNPSVDVTVDRASGRCAGALVLHVPARAAAGSSVPVTGIASDTSTVAILFRRRGQTQFEPRRALNPAADGSFSTSVIANDDYRLYAETDRCDSPSVLLQAMPIVAGPRAVARNTDVTVRVRAAGYVGVSLYFHREGTAVYALARRGTTGADGTYTTKYRATADYRYYAITGPGNRRSNSALTQAR